MLIGKNLLEVSDKYMFVKTRVKNQMYQQSEKEHGAMHIYLSQSKKASKQSYVLRKIA